MAKKKEKVETKPEMVARLREEQRKDMVGKIKNILLKCEIKGSGGIVRAVKNKHRPL